MALHFLCFETQADDSDSTTWEAMASVAPGHWPALWDEAHMLLQQLQQLLPTGPAALDEGADWDALLQVQADDGAPHPLAWPLVMGTSAPTPQASHASGVSHSTLSSQAPHVPGLCASTRWVALTLTLAVGAAHAQAAGELLQTD